MTLSYSTVDSPVGRLLIAATDHGVVRLVFEREGFASALESLERHFGTAAVEDHEALAQARTQLDEYWSGWRHSFDVPLDTSLSSGFKQTVQEQLTEIPYGTTWTYGELARHAGNPKAVRPVGTACATNPLPIFVPCHRVVRADRGLGGYLGGVEAKTYLLEHERSHSA